MQQKISNKPEQFINFVAKGRRSHWMQGMRKKTIAGVAAIRRGFFFERNAADIGFSSIAADFYE
jgi:hypothetical protein